MASSSREVCLAALLSWATACAVEPAPATIRIRAERAVAESSARFLSFAIDSSNIGKPYDFTRPRLRRMAAALSPAYFRIGGTASDTIYYDLSDSPVPSPPAPFKAVLTREWWDAACDFASELGLEILFTLNVGPGPRDAAGRFDPDNARQLIRYTRARGCPVTVWELGNEINGFVRNHDLALDGRAYADDMAIARQLVDAEDPQARLVGPASAYFPLLGEIIPIMPDFLSAGGPLVDAITWHYYPQQSHLCPLGRPAETDTLLEPQNLDEVASWAQEIESLRDRDAPRTEIWLGESGHAQCGGEPGLSDRFVTGFWWLDQLGLLARRGHSVVVRQALTGGRYHLIDNASLEPRPDYFNSILWKRLMGQRALDVDVAASPVGAKLRVYAHCTPAEAGPSGGVTALVINLDRERAVRLAFSAVGARREIYPLSGPDLLGTEIRLDNLALAVDGDGTLPPPRSRTAQDPIVLEPVSYAFVVLPEADAPACR